MMKLRLLTGDRGALQVRWMDEETGNLRTPGGKTRAVHAAAFEAGCKPYRSRDELAAQMMERGKRVFLDVHDRYVLHLRERYPCFDWADRATEKRYYNWYLILGDGQWSMVYYDDGTGDMTVTDDLAVIPAKQRDLMERIYGVIRVSEYELNL